MKKNKMKSKWYKEYVFIQAIFWTLVVFFILWLTNATIDKLVWIAINMENGLLYVRILVGFIIFIGVWQIVSKLNKK